MTKSVFPRVNDAPASAREPRPFLYLEPRAATSEVAIDEKDLAQLDGRVSDSVPRLTRAVVDYTIALQNRRSLEHGNVQPIVVSVLNRRRRAARAWILAILAGKTDASTQHAVAAQWLPTLCASGPDLARCVHPAASLVEFVRGAITACIFDAPADNLVPRARAQHALEQVLSVHLTAIREAGRGTPSGR